MSTLEEARLTAIKLWKDGNCESALDVLSDALKESPGDCLSWNDLGVLSFLNGNYVCAEQSFVNALSYKPSFPPALRGLSEVLLRLNRYREAIQVLTEYLKVDSTNLGAQLSLMECFCKLGKLAEASRLAEFSYKQNPESVDLLVMMAKIYQQQKSPGKFLHAIRSAASLKPKNSDLCVELAFAYWEFGCTEEAIWERDRALKMDLGSRNLYSSLLWLSLHDPDQTAIDLRQKHEKAVRYRTSVDCLSAAPGLIQSRNDQLRIGYVSGEFIGGPAFYFLSSWLKHFDQRSIHSTFYSSRSGRGAKADFFKNIATQWLDISNVSDAKVVELIRNDRIDILVDLSGHYDGNRLEVFQCRPTPVQVTFPNYPSTTGVKEINYILTDRWVTPDGSEQEYVETPYRLPSGYLVYEQPDDLPPIQPLPALQNGFITFGMFQRPGKYHNKFWNLVSDVLETKPNSRLLIHFASAELDDNYSEQRRFLTQVLADRGVSSKRLMFAGERQHLEHMLIVSQADVALDSYPYNGQTTTCDCLWMGVPVITMLGQTHVSRIGSSLMNRLGLSNLVTHSEESYIRSAVSLASDLKNLDEMRAGLRQNARLHLGNGKRLAQEILDAYRWMSTQQL